MERFDDYLHTVLKNGIEAKNYINAALEQFFIDHNKELFLLALKQVIDARGGVTKVAKQTNINRQHLYRMLSKRGNPSFDNISLLLGTIGLRLTVEASKAA